MGRANVCCAIPDRSGSPAATHPRRSRSARPAAGRNETPEGPRSFVEKAARGAEWDAGPMLRHLKHLDSALGVLGRSSEIATLREWRLPPEAIARAMDEATAALAADCEAYGR